MKMYRILVVDDDPGIRSLYRLELEDAGHEVRTAAGGSDALLLACRWAPDLAVLDIKLGEENGLDLLRRLCDLQPRLLTLLVSGYPGYRDDFTSWLADAFLTKSVDPSQLVRTVQDLLAADPVG